MSVGKMKPARKWKKDAHFKSGGECCDMIIAAIQNDAYAAGAAAMRERAVARLEASGAFVAAEAIRALPLTAPSAGVPPCSHPERLQYRDDDGEWHCENCEATGRDGTDPSKGSAIP